MRSVAVSLPEDRDDPRATADVVLEALGLPDPAITLATPVIGREPSSGQPDRSRAGQPAARSRSAWAFRASVTLISGGM